MIRIPALDVILEQDTLNRIADERLPKTPAFRSMSLEILPNLIRFFIDAKLPLVGDSSVTADLTTELRGNELWLRLERTSLPLVPKAAVVGMVASQIKLEGVRAEGSSLVLDLVRLFSQFEVETQVHSLVVDRGYVRVMCLMEGK
jgi:hypothetical protein